MKTLGIIGGLGPQATAYFMRLVVEMTQAKKDQDHIPSIVISNPQIPDRTDYILNKSRDNPIKGIVDIGRQLSQLGAQYIAMPCITAHYFHDIIQDKIPVPVINGIACTAQYAKQAGIESIGILATDGTIKSQLFQQEFEKYGICVVLPHEQDQKKVMQLIYQNVKAGMPVELDEFQTVTDNLKRNGAQVQVLGCTELSIIKRDYEIGNGYLDAMEVLARQSVKYCGLLKENYEQLI